MALQHAPKWSDTHLQLFLNPDWKTAVSPANAPFSGLFPPLHTFAIILSIHRLFHWLSRNEISLNKDTCLQIGLSNNNSWDLDWSCASCSRWIILITPQVLSWVALRLINLRLREATASMCRIQKCKTPSRSLRPNRDNFPKSLSNIFSRNYSFYLEAWGFQYFPWEIAIFAFLPHRSTSFFSFSFRLMQMCFFQHSSLHCFLAKCVL